MADNKTNTAGNEIIFRIGEETGIVIEKENFSKSLFREHYVKALQIANDIIGREEQDASSNVIAFCADRGEGKTSCMQTVADLLTIKERYDKFKEEITEAKGFANINPKELHRLALIDPAFFDEKHNIIELITGMMYETINKKDCCKNLCVDETAKLIAKFREVQKGLEYIQNNTNSEIPIYDPLEKVQSLSKGLKLRDMIKNLIDAYLKYIDKEYLVICIDDIDLNILYAYRMTEQIRKYLSGSKCIILFATNVEQLTSVIRHSMEKELYGRVVEGEDLTCQEMAAKYVTKLLPTSQRINLVHITDLYNKPLILQDTDRNEIGRWEMVKEAISQLIYVKTRYLFYNNESETSPIVPKNLRSFRHLMRLLTNLSDFYNAQIRENIENPSPTEKQKEEKAKGEENKSIFRNYFYQDWVANNLTTRDANFATTLVEYSDVSGINLLVVQYLSTRFKLSNIGKSVVSVGSEKSTKKTVGIEDLIIVLNLSEEEQQENEMEERLERNFLPTVQAIVDNQNKSYNISLGDVFYLLAFLQRSSTSIEDKMLLFFVKSFYSMRLYEYYDIITEQKGTLYPIRDTTGSRISIYRVDDTYEHTNVLQRFVNGSYFTYLPNEFMAFDIAKKMPRDLRLINAKAVKDLFREVINKFPKDYKDVSPMMKLKFQLCEFLCWTISRTAYAPQGIDYINAALLDRRQNTPAFYGTFRPKTTLYVFDICAPFYNAINIKYAYNRIIFVKDQDFYELAKNYSDSLLNKAIRATIVDRKKQWAKIDTETKEEKKQQLIEDAQVRVLTESDYYTMLSGAIIRNADVLISLRDHIVSKKNDVSKEGAHTLQLLRLCYEEIINSEMYTYQTDDDTNYEIRFSFLGALVDFLKELTPTNETFISNDHAEVAQLLSNVLFAFPKKTRKTKTSSKRAKDSFEQKLEEKMENIAVEQVANTLMSTSNKK